MQELCTHRWHALYACARRRGLAADRAEDAVQGLLLQLCEHDFLDRLDPQRGSLRSYLKQALRHYLVNEYEREGAVKRGGGQRALSIDSVEARLPSAPDDPEVLESEYTSGIRTGPVGVLRELFRFGDASPYEKIASENGMTVPQLKSFVHRARLRFKELLLARIVDTVGSEREAAAELDDLLRAMAS